MRSTLTIPGLALVLAGLPATVAGQDSDSPGSILTPGEIQALIVERGAPRSGERAALEAFLDHEEVRRVARDAGIDIFDVTSAAATLSEEELGRLAPLVEGAEAALAGGDTIVLSSTAVIIGLLILILILVA